MEFMARYNRLLVENCRFDFHTYLEMLARYDEGENVPAIPREQRHPGRPHRNDYLAPAQYYRVAVVASHLGIDERPDPLSDLRRVVELESEIFFGKWWHDVPDADCNYKYPRPPHEERSRFFEYWVNDYCYGVLCALILDDDWTAGRIGCYPGPDVTTDDGDRGLRRPDMFFHVILGTYLRYGEDRALDEWIRAVRDGQSVRAKLWLKALQAIDRGRGDAFKEVFLELASHHRTHEYKARMADNFMPGPFTLIMQEGSILWHLARRKGIAPAWEDLPEDVSDHLLTLETATRKA